jgi:hypothetical protein
MGLTRRLTRRWWMGRAAILGLVLGVGTVLGCGPGDPKTLPAKEGRPPANTPPAKKTAPQRP